MKRVGAARGTSIIVPIRIGGAPGTAAKTDKVSARTVSSAWTVPTSRTMISGRGSPPAATRAAAACATGSRRHQNAGCHSPVGLALLCRGFIVDEGAQI